MSKWAEKSPTYFKWFCIFLLAICLLITIFTLQEQHFQSKKLILFNLSWNAKKSIFFGQSGWEWINTLSGPLVISLGGAIGGFVLNRYLKDRDDKQREQDKKIEEDRLRQAALINYFDQMTQLLIRTDWSLKTPIIALAKAITFAVLNELDGKRKGSLIIFLLESKASDYISMDKSNLIDTVLNKVTLDNINLHGSYLINSDLCDSYLTEADLSYVDLSDAKLTNTSLIKADLSYANLSRTDLRKAWLSGAMLDNTDLSGADLRDTDLKGVYFKGVKISDQTKIDHKWRIVHKLLNEGGTGGDYNNADLAGVNLTNATLININLSKANLKEAILHGANLKEANLGDAILRSADLRGADLSYAKLKGADLRNADLTKTNLYKAEYDNESLSQEQIQSSINRKPETLREEDYRLEQP